MAQEEDLEICKENLAEAKERLNFTKENIALIKERLRAMKKDIPKIDDKKDCPKTLRSYKKLLESWKDTVASYYNLKVVANWLEKTLLEPKAC